MRWSKCYYPKSFRYLDNQTQIMKLFTLLLFVLSSPAYTQAPKKVKKIFAEDFNEMKGESNYPLIPSSKNIFYPSWTMKGDTTGVSNGSEFLLFKDSISFYPQEDFKFFKTSFVTNQEWNKLIDRAVDSISREKLYLNQDPTGESKYKMSEKQYRQLKVPYEDTLSQAGTNAWAYFYTYSSNPWNYDFDWKKKIAKRIWRPLIGDLYTRPNERFWRVNKLDERKWYFKIRNEHNGWLPMLGLEHEEVNVSKNHDLWAINSLHSFDIYSNLASYYGHSKHYDDEPVVGVLGTQIKAYMYFIESEYQKEINELNLSYDVKVSLPTQDDIDENFKLNQKQVFVTASHDMTEHWRITNADYKEFLDYVEDSICREELYINAAIKSKYDITTKILKHEKTYYDEFDLKWKEYDKTEPLLNRSLWNLNFNYSWEGKIEKEFADSVLAKFRTEGQFKKRNYVYHYYWVDYKRRSNPGDLIWTYFHEQYSGYECKNVYADCHDKDMSNGIRRHEDNGRFILKEEVSLYPGIDCREHNESCELLTLSETHKDSLGNYVDCGRCSEGEFQQNISHYDFMTNPELLIQNITYHQALAYYNWKYQKQNVFKDSETAIYDDLVPSEEEFRKVQAGEKVEYKAEKIAYPTPLFRYVVHFYKK